EVGGGDPRVARESAGEMLDDDVMAVNQSVEPGRDLEAAPRIPHHPHRQMTVEKEQEEENDPAENIAEADRCFLAVDLYRPLPMLQFQPRADQQSDHQGHREPPDTVRRVAVFHAQSADPAPDAGRAEGEEHGHGAKDEQPAEKRVAG